MAELDGGGGDTQRTRQYPPEVRARQNEADGVAFEAKPVGTLSFGLVEQTVQGECRATVAVHAQAPDVDRARREFDHARTRCGSAASLGAIDSSIC
jgi:hypothetical protein